MPISEVQQQNTNPIADKELDQLINSPLFQNDPVVQKSPPIHNDPLIKSGSLNDPFHRKSPPIRNDTLIKSGSLNDPFHRETSRTASYWRMMLLWLRTGMIRKPFFY